MAAANQQKFVFGALAVAAVLGGTIAVFRVLAPPRNGIGGSTEQFTLEFSRNRHQAIDHFSRSRLRESAKNPAMNVGANTGVPLSSSNLSGLNAAGAGSHSDRVSASSSGATELSGEEAAVNHAIELVDSGKVDEATKELEAILAKNPRQEQALIELGMIHLIDNHHPEEALPLLKTALQINPNNRMVASEIVGICEERGNGDEGLAFLKELYTGHPEADSLAAGIGQILISQGKDTEAVPYMETAARNSPDPAFHLAELGDIYGRMGDHEKSARAYDAAISKEVDGLSKNTDSASTRIIQERIDNLLKDKANAQIESGDLDAAEETLRKIKDQHSDDKSMQALRKKLVSKRG